MHIMISIKPYLVGLVSFLFYLLPYNIHAQKSLYVPGELIIQTDGTPVNQVLAEVFPGTSRQKSSMQTKPMSSDMGYHIINFDPDKMDENQLLSKLKANSHVLAVQRNHYLTARKRPDDPRFDEQWSLRSNTSLYSDIEIEAAWDITTGGKIGNKHDKSSITVSRLIIRI